MDVRLALFAAGICLLGMCACVDGIVCAGCSGYCPPAPVGCPLSREPCGCCDVCALSMGERCHGFSPGCGPGLMCHTPAGNFELRPPPDSNLHGRCVISTLQTTTTPAPNMPPVGRK